MKPYHEYSSISGALSMKRHIDKDGKHVTSISVDPSPEGAARGAVAGAIAGSFIPVVGTVVGAGVGAVFGGIFGK